MAGWMTDGSELNELSRLGRERDVTPTGFRQAERRHVCAWDVREFHRFQSQARSEADRGACANPEWRNATGDYLDAVIRHTEARYEGRVKANVLACGQTDEWMDDSRGVAGRLKTQAWIEWLQTHGRPKAPVPALERLDRGPFENLSFSGHVRRPPAEALRRDPKSRLFR